MWPFAKKQTEQDPEETELQHNEKLCSAFRKWKPTGSKFEYLGRQMVATGHQDVELVGCTIYLRPRLTADYADDLGKIHRIEFSAAEVMAMMAQDADGMDTVENKSRD